jgi:hypothetical protein
MPFSIEKLNDAIAKYKETQEDQKKHWFTRIQEIDISIKTFYEKIKDLEGPMIVKKAEGSHVFVLLRDDADATGIPLIGQGLSYDREQGQRLAVRVTDGSSLGILVMRSDKRNKWEILRGVSIGVDDEYQLGFLIFVHKYEKNRIDQTDQEKFLNQMKHQWYKLMMFDDIPIAEKMIEYAVNAVGTELDPSFGANWQEAG